VKQRNKRKRRKGKSFRQAENQKNLEKKKKKTEASWGRSLKAKRGDQVTRGESRGHRKNDIRQKRRGGRTKIKRTHLLVLSNRGYVPEPAEGGRAQ